MSSEHGLMGILAEAVSENPHVESWQVVASLGIPCAITSLPSSVSSFAKTDFAKNPVAKTLR
jgi:hypothetical protein